MENLVKFLKDKLNQLGVDESDSIYGGFERCIYDVQDFLDARKREKINVHDASFEIDEESIQQIEQILDLEDEGIQEAHERHYLRELYNVYIKFAMYRESLLLKSVESFTNEAIKSGARTSTGQADGAGGVLMLEKERIRNERVTSAQNTGRTLIDVMNRYLTTCPHNFTLTTSVNNYKHSLQLFEGEKIFFEIKDLNNLQACYEELFDYVCATAFLK